MRFKEGIHRNTQNRAVASADAGLEIAVALFYFLEKCSVWHFLYVIFSDAKIFDWKNKGFWHF